MKLLEKKSRYTDPNYLKKWREKNIRWSSKYLGKQICPKCGKEGLTYAKVKTNIKTGSKVITGFLVHHPNPIYTPPWRTYCNMSRNKTWKIFGNLIEYDFEQNVPTGAPKGSGKYSIEDLKKMTTYELKLLAYGRHECKDTQGLQEVLKEIKIRDKGYMYRIGRKYSTKQLEKLPLKQLKAIYHNRVQSGDKKESKEIKSIIEKQFPNARFERAYSYDELTKFSIKQLTTLYHTRRQDENISGVKEVLIILRNRNHIFNRSPNKRKALEKLKKTGISEKEGNKIWNKWEWYARERLLKVSDLQKFFEWRNKIERIQ